MPRDKLPWFPFYPSDFETDGHVEAMSPAEVGGYIRLLCKAWNERPVATIPADDIVLARWCRMTPEEWTESKARILVPWERVGDRWRQGRMAKIAQEQELKHTLRVERARRGGNAKAVQIAACSTTQAGHKQSISSVQARHKHPASTLQAEHKSASTSDSDSDSTVVVSSSVSVVGGERGGGSEEPNYHAVAREVRAAYPMTPRGKTGEEAVLQAILSLNPLPDDVTVRAMVTGAAYLAASSLAREEGGKFLRNLDRWIAEKGWQDDPAPATTPFDAPGPSRFSSRPDGKLHAADTLRIADELERREQSARKGVAT